MDDLERALANKDCEQLKLTAHSLKSSSANVGATTLAEFCKRLETAAAFDDLVLAEQLVVSIVRESQDVRSALAIEAAKITQSTAA